MSAEQKDQTSQSDSGSLACPEATISLPCHFDFRNALSRPDPRVAQLQSSISAEQPISWRKPVSSCSLESCSCSFSEVYDSFENLTLDSLLRTPNGRCQYPDIESASIVWSLSQNGEDVLAEIWTVKNHQKICRLLQTLQHDNRTAELVLVVNVDFSETTPLPPISVQGQPSRRPTSMAKKPTTILTVVMLRLHCELHPWPQQNADVGRDLYFLRNTALSLKTRFIMLPANESVPFECLKAKLQAAISGVMHVAIHERGLHIREVVNVQMLHSFQLLLGNRSPIGAKTWMEKNHAEVWHLLLEALKSAGERSADITVPIFVEFTDDVKAEAEGSTPPGSRIGGLLD